MLFSALGIHHDEQLLITTDPWDERRARELMQEELLIRLYNHVYADPVYWNHLDEKPAFFSLHLLLRPSNRMPFSAVQRRHCCTVSALLTRCLMPFRCCCRDLPGAIHMSSLSIVDGARARYGVSARLRLQTPIGRWSILPARVHFGMRLATSMDWLVSTMLTARSCVRMHRPIVAVCMASPVRLACSNIWTEGRITGESPRRERQ